MITMLISGGLAGLLGVNEIMGVQHKLMLNLVAGYGFTGIAVALMGRNHPVGIIMASILFGALFQGGAELSFDMPIISKDMVFVIQGLIILFSGALAHMSKPWVEKLFTIFRQNYERRADGFSLFSMKYLSILSATHTGYLHLSIFLRLWPGVFS